MNADKVFNIFGAIVTVALITTIVARKNSANVIKAVGDTFAGGINAALGGNVRNLS